MKKTLITILAALATFASQAQNIQVHYDFGRTFYSSEQPDRQKVLLHLNSSKQTVSAHGITSLTLMSKAKEQQADTLKSAVNLTSSKTLHSLHTSSSTED